MGKRRDTTPTLFDTEDCTAVADDVLGSIPPEWPVVRLGEVTYEGIVVTMIHKFDDIPANVCLRENVYVLVDEARQVAAAFAEFPHWQTSSHQEQDLRKALYRALIGGGVSTVVDYARRIITMLRGAKR
jgi:hypothetical protein